jgi:hypothetical protein
MKSSGKLSTYLIFVGSDRDDNAVFRLFDDQSNVRLRMQVYSLGNPAIEFLDKNGEVKKRITDK